MKVTLISYTPNPEQVVAAAAKLCYSNSSIEDLFDGLNEEKSAEFLNRLSDLGHSSPTEHASFTFGIEGISRSCLAQLTRHRIASYSVQSQRYVKLSDFRYVIPPEIEDNEYAEQCFLDAMNKDAEYYLSLVESLTRNYMKEYLEKTEVDTQEHFDSVHKQAEKQALEDARFVLPNACETKLVMTMNVRSLNNFFSLRCCNRAQWEIRRLSEEMFKLVYEVAPNLFSKSGPSCVVNGTCSEGKMSCGKMIEVQRKYDMLKTWISRGF